MTRAQALATMGTVRPLLAGYDIAGIDGLDGDLGQLMVRTPAGTVVAVAVPLGPLFPVANIVALLAAVQATLRETLRPFEGDCGRGFNGRRGKLMIGSPGFSANEGWV